MICTSGAVAAPEVVRFVICLMQALKLEKKEKVISLITQVGKFKAFKQLELDHSEFAREALALRPRSMSHSTPMCA